MGFVQPGGCRGRVALLLLVLLEGEGEGVGAGIFVLVIEIDWESGEGWVAGRVVVVRGEVKIWCACRLRKMPSLQGWSGI